jgi:hypothetical protein
VAPFLVVVASVVDVVGAVVAVTVVVAVPVPAVALTCVVVVVVGVEVAVAVTVVSVVATVCANVTLLTTSAAASVDNFTAGLAIFVFFMMFSQKLVSNRHCTKHHREELLECDLLNLYHL